MTRDLRGKVAIITGASSGIGGEPALAFAREGVRLVLAARREERLREVAEAVNAMDGEALVVPTDMGVKADVDHIMDAALSRFGQVDILVNNAGYGLFATVEDTTTEDLRRIMEVTFLEEV
ncbi:MAG: SDR family NAD(P)-dependent oxidoreductase [Acidobacteria bacterium]|nr:SDR family NAD(P)-dependent oxidoreductase [Acidobacteriota bacterium]